MPANAEDVLALVKSRLGITVDTHDAVIDSYVGEIGQRILSDCNIAEVPNELKFVWTSMTIDVLKAEQQSIPEIAAASPASVDLKIGDTTVKESVGKPAPKSAIDAIVLNYNKDLSRFRKLRW